MELYLKSNIQNWSHQVSSNRNQSSADAVENDKQQEYTQDQYLRTNAIDVFGKQFHVWRPVSPNTINLIIKNQEEEAERWLARVREKDNDKKIKLRTEFIIDSMSIVVVEYAERENIDLIVIGSRANRLQ